MSNDSTSISTVRGWSNHEKAQLVDAIIQAARPGDPTWLRHWLGGNIDTIIQVLARQQALVPADVPYVGPAAMRVAWQVMEAEQEEAQGTRYRRWDLTTDIRPAMGLRKSGLMQTGVISALAQGSSMIVVEPKTPRSLRGKTTVFTAELHAFEQQGALAALPKRNDSRVEATVPPALSVVPQPLFHVLERVFEHAPADVQAHKRGMSVDTTLLQRRKQG